MQVRILVVDEAAFVRDNLKRALRAFLTKDVDVFDANTGVRALSVLRTNRIDLVMSCWDIPEKPAHELIQWMRENENYAKTPVIILSEENDKSMVMKAINAGATDFMAKPFSPEDVQNKVVKQLSRINCLPKGAAEKFKKENSLSVLTAGNASPQVVVASEAKGGAEPLTKPKIAPKPKAKSTTPSTAQQTSKTGNFEGIAHLHFEGFTTKCLLRELSLTTLGGLIEKLGPEKMPRLFDTASADIENKKGEALGTLKIYVHSLVANEPRPESRAIKIVCRFHDNAPEQFEKLSKVIAQSR